MQTISYRLTVVDLIDARRYAHNSLPLVKAIRKITFAMIIGCLLLGAYRAIRQDWTGVASLGGLFVLGLVLIVWIYVGNRWLLPPAVRKELASNKGLQGDHAVFWNTSCLTLDGSHGQSRWPWNDFYRWQESAGGLLLWPGNRTYFYVPKRVLSDSQLSEVRANLSRAIGKPGRKRK